MLTLDRCFCSFIFAAGSVRRPARTPGSKGSASASTPKSKGSTSTPRKIAGHSTPRKIATTPSAMVNTPRRSTRSASKRGSDEANVLPVEVFAKKQKVSSAKKAPAKKAPAKKAATTGPRQPTTPMASPAPTKRKLTKAEMEKQREKVRNDFAEGNLAGVNKK